jgi:subtilisin
MRPHRVTRRNVLWTVVTGSVATAALGDAAAGKPPRYVVGTASRRAERAAKRGAERVNRVHDFGGIGKAVAGRFPEQAAERLAERPDVRYVEAEGRYEAIETLPWGVDRVDADLAHADGYTGGGGDIAILDTGIDADHPDLQANLGTGRAYVDSTSGGEPWDDDNGHGTHCAGIADAVDDTEGVRGVSTDATLHAVKVLASDGYGYYSDIAAGIEWVANQGYDVASLSLGGTSGSYTIRDACQYAVDSGVLVVAAAGNDGTADSVRYPAKYDTVVAVSATTSSDDLAYFSSYGPEVELAAPGYSIYSTVVGGYGYKSGTSMACPHVAGAGGQLMAAGLSNTEARETLRDTAEDVGLSENEQGYGLLDVGTAVGSLGSTDPPVAVSTDGASSIGTDSATLNGTLDDLGGASSAAVSFEYRQVGASSWTAMATETRSTAGSFGATVSGLASGTDHEFRAVADASDGDADTGSTSRFATDTADTSVVVSTDTASNVGTDTATLSGTLDDLGGASSAAVSFEYRETGASGWTATTPETRSTTGGFSRSVSGLASGTDHEFRAVADASDGDADTGSTNGFATDTADTNAAPTVDAYSVSEAGSPNPHLEATANWRVGDGDGNLASVTVELIDSQDRVVDTASTGVSGSSASGSDSFKIKHARGATYTVELTVTDSAGASATATRSVTE